MAGQARQVLAAPLMSRSHTHRQPSRQEPRPWEWLYEIVGFGMWAVSRARFDVQVVGRVPRVARGQVWIATHRAETDVPLIGGLLTTRGGMWRPGAARMHFAARDDLFAPGVVSAGLRLPGRLARVAWQLTPGTWLPRVRAHPVRRPVGLKLSQALGGVDPDVPVADVVGPQILVALAARASQVGRRPPSTVGEARDATFARALWQDVTRDDLCGHRGGEVWRSHVTRAAGDLRRLVGVVRDGEPLLLFPEGRVSPDGSIGPVGDVLEVIVRRGSPTSVVPIGIAYDPLRRGRVTVAVNVGSPHAPDGTPLCGLMSDRLRRCTPVTVGQVVARELTAVAASGGGMIASRSILEALADTHDRARHEHRPSVRGIRSAGRRVRSLARALDALEARGLTEGGPLGDIRIHPDAVLADAVVQRLVQEDRAVWQSDATPPDP